ncbi:IS1096 element passenger TnpR family protein [Namhaeicola litoreus]|uniref:Plasmid pRiA4b Orf3-like domain-containing protein n=1 Tax=Namhaeicola litoreus TaxID=1052145 RepID=A0ABW3Y2K6_9FLAO
MSYKIRVILDAEENVVRDIIISKSLLLEDLHNAITNAFGFNGAEMASFYLADKDWNEGEEFPLFDMSEKPGQITQMSEISISDVMTEVGDKLIYVYDYLNMWTFFVEVMEITQDFLAENYAKVAFSLGHLPQNAPEKQFEADDFSEFDMDEDEDELDDDFDPDGFSIYE